MNIQESKPENREKVRNLPLKMKGTEQSVIVILLKKKESGNNETTSNRNGIDFHVLILIVELSINLTMEKLQFSCSFLSQWNPLFSLFCLSFQWLY